MELSTIVRAIESWSIEQRLQLIDCIWKSLVASGWQPEMTDEVQDELDEHWNEIGNTPEDAEFWNRLERTVRRQSKA